MTNSRPSVVIPTLNAARFLPSLLHALGRQSVACEIIVADSSSTDDTLRIAESFGVRTLTVDRKQFDHGGTRNLALRNTSGAYVVFLTQDALPVDESLLENLVTPLEQPGVALSYGRQVPREDATPPERFARLFNYPESPLLKGKEDIGVLGIKTFYCSNACSAVRKDAFEEAGGFPEKIIMNEDMILASKLIQRGYKVAYASSAMVYHSHNYSLREQFRRYFDIGVSLSRNRWIIGLAKPEGEGLRVLKEELVYLIRRGQWHWIPYVPAEAFVKYAGFRLGLIERYLPPVVKPRLSMHKHFWRDCDKITGSKETA